MAWDRISAYQLDAWMLELLQKRGGQVTRTRFRRPMLALILLILGLLTLALTGARVSHGTHHASAVQGDSEATSALGRHLAARTSFAPPGSSDYLEGSRSSADEEDLIRAAPGTAIPAPLLEQSTRDWSRARDRGDAARSHWDPLGPTWGKNLPNPYRDRSVYTSGTQNFSGRIAHVAIDPSCGNRGNSDEERGGCRLWIANANGGVWRTNNALADQPEWKYLSMAFEHNNVASLQLD